MVSLTRITKSAKGLANLSTRKVAVALVFAISAAYASAQSGILSGTVVDADYGGGVPGAYISLLGTEITARSDKDGKYTIQNVPVGEYTLIATANYYKSSKVEELVILDGLVKQIDVPLYGDESDIVELEGYTVKAEALAGSSLSLLADRQKSSSISDAIGSESFGRLGIGDAADALSKTTGASIVDGKYVVIRGLSDRYNNTTLNGSTVPSADPNKRAVQLDQFPAGIIESIVTSKSFTPDKAGNFTGGSVNIVTKSVPNAGFMTVSLGVAYNEKTTFGDYLASDGSGSDWLGQDDGSRSIPRIVLEAESIPVTPSGQSKERLDLIDSVVKSFSPQLAPEVKTAPLDHSFSVAFGDRYPIGDAANGPVIGVIGSINYKRSFSAYDDGLVGRYELEGRDLSLGVKQAFAETKGVSEAQWGSVLNTAVVFSGNHELGIKTMYNQSGEDEAILRTGSYREAVSDGVFNARNLHFTERTLSSYQLYGEHRFEGLYGLMLDWEASTSKSVQEEPDFRLFYDSLEAGVNGRASYTGNFPAPRRYWRELDESTDELKASFTLPLGDKSNELKFGFLTSETERNFQERSFIYADFVGTVYDGDAESFLSPEKLGYNKNGKIQRFIREFVGFVPRYSGTQRIDAAYLMVDFRPFEKWRLITGARIEEAYVKVQSFGSNGSPLENDGSLDDRDWLPALQIVNELTENQNLRLAYSRTIARPNFRELSPFGSFDNVGGEVFIGNPDLKRTQIENLDLRYEWFLGVSDLLAVSLFHKRLENPIEQAYVEGQLSFLNVDEGSVSGIELEARRGLAFLSGENNEISVGGNLSVVESEVERTEVELADKRLRDPEASLTRELQGQSALIGNFDIFWNRPQQGSSFSLVYNHTGERLYSVSTSALPDIYQEPSDSLDFIYSQKLPRGFSMKLTFKNMLDDESTRVWADFNEDLIYSNVSKGRTVSLSFSKRFE